jgi:hypothetical protein
MYERPNHSDWMLTLSRNAVSHSKNASLSPMKFPTIPRLARTHRRLPLANAAFVAAFAIGCASPGPPRPPSLKLPRLVNDLNAQRIGDDVQLHWITPTKTTDDLDIKGPITAEICRESVIKSPQPSATQRTVCVPVKRFALHSGPSDATDTLPPALTADPLSLLAYRIQIFNSNGHSAGLSPKAFTLAGSSPPPVEQLRAESTRFGAQLEWQPTLTTYPIELDRILVPTSLPLKSTPKPKASQSFNLSSSAPVEVHLQAGNQTSDPGGTIDHNAQRGDAYRYTAQRIRKAVIASHTLELRSAPSPIVTVLMRDTFPPATPASLAAIPGGTNSADRSIDLSWEPVPDPDVAGYIIYRQEITSAGALTGHPTRLNASPVVGPAFSDHTAVPGQHYAYRVTAIDTSGNESAPSADIQETLREQ